MATYQDLGYYADGVLTVLSPVRQVKQFEITRHDLWQFDEEPIQNVDDRLLQEAVAFYQTVNMDHYKK